MPGFSVLLTILSEEVYLNQICFELNLLFVFEVQNPCVRPAEFSFEGWRMLNPNLNFPKHCPNSDEPELKIEYLWMSLAQRRRLRRVSLRPFFKWKEFLKYSIFNRKYSIVTRQ
jgi:hypothetical protein